MTDKVEVVDNDEINNLSDKDFIKTRRAYDEIKQLFMDSVPECDYPSYDEWLELIDKEQLHIEPRLGIVVPPGLPSAIRGYAEKAGMDYLRSQGLKWGSADEMLSSMRQRVETNLRQRAERTASTIYEKFTDEGDGGTSKVDFQGGSRFNMTGMSQTLKPIDTSFSTEIPFQGQTRYWQDGANNTGPLFIKSGMPGLISVPDNSVRDAQMWDYITGPITMEWNAKIASYITWTGRVVTLCTEIKICDYINRCLSACNTYYFWRSVIAFTDDPRNKNAAMDTLRNLLTPTDYNNLFNLRRELMQCAIPPFVHEFCFYMNGTYRQSHLPTSPLMKIMPCGFASTSGAYFTGAMMSYGGQSQVDIARGHLDQLKEYNNVLSRAIGIWGGVEPFEYTSSPRVDPDYTTFWCNASYQATNTTGPILLPQITDDGDEICYNTHTDAPDGWISAMSSVVNTTDNTYGVGLFKPWNLDTAGTNHRNIASIHHTTKYSSCFMYKNDGTPGFYPVESAQIYQALSGNTYNTLATTGIFHKFQKFGTERIILVTRNALRQANFQFLDLLYCSDFRNLPVAGMWRGIVAGKEANSSGKPKPYSGRKRGGKSSKSSKSSKGKDYDSASIDKDEI